MENNFSPQVARTEVHRESLSAPTMLCVVNPLEIPFGEDQDLSDDETTFNCDTNLTSSSYQVPAFVCHHCGYSTDGKRSIRTHIADEHPEAFLPIGKIPARLIKHKKNVVSSRTLRKLLRNKIPRERPYFCPHCEYRSAQSGVLKRHIMGKHTDERPYTCPYCDYKSSQSAPLKSHIMAKHTGERPFSCDLCEYKTARSGHLKKHIMAKHTGERPYSCPHCDYKSSHQGNMKIHVRSIHTDERPYPCPHCEYKSATYGVLKKHIRAKHSREWS